MLDPAGLVAAYGPIDAHYKAQLHTVLHGGRFNAEALGALAVNVREAGGASATHALRELAQVVPRGGRSVSLLVHEAAFIKPIMSAVQAARHLNQQPQRAPDNELELLLRVEPERRDELARRVADAARAWRDRVRQARARHDRALRDARRAGAVLPDALHRAERALQKAQDSKMREIDAAEADALRRLGPS